MGGTKACKTVAVFCGEIIKDDILQAKNTSNIFYINSFIYIHSPSLKMCKQIEEVFQFQLMCLEIFFIRYDNNIPLSLTNIESDLQIGIFYKKKNTPVIATVRSWDNLVTKGILRFSPDIFLSHSKYMSEIAIQKSHRTCERIADKIWGSVSR
jgi:hypothetical protein